MSMKAKGQTVTPTPMAKLNAKMNLMRRLWRSKVDAKEMPLANTLAKRKIVIPPKTASGMDVITPAILEKVPIKINQKAQA